MVWSNTLGTIVDSVPEALPKVSYSDDDITTFTVKLQSPEVKRTAADEIEHLNATVKEIRQGFTTIAAQLADFDRNHFQEQNGDVIEFGVEWQGYRETFDSILETSHRNATDAAAFMKQFDVILEYFDDPDYSMDDVKTEVQAFAKRLDDRSKVALTTQEEFRHLAEEIRLFQKNVENRLAGAEEKLVDQEAAITQKLHELHGRIHQLAEEMKKVGLACLTGLGIGTAAIAAAVLTLAPEAMYVAVGSLLTAAATGWEFKNKLSEKRKTKEQIKACHQELDRTVSEHALLSKYQKAFNESSSDILLLASKIDAIACIWQTIKSEMQQFEEQLNLAAGQDMPITKFFPKKVAATREIYKHLVELLESYANEYSNDSQ